MSKKEIKYMEENACIRVKMRGETIYTKKHGKGTVVSREHYTANVWLGHGKPWVRYGLKLENNPFGFSPVYFYPADIINYVF